MPPEKRPNLLLIVSDQHRADCVGWAKNHLGVRTPNLDRLASEGVRFDAAYTSLPVCCPARQALMTGQRPEAFGALWNYDNGPRVYSITPEDWNWVEALRRGGVQTAHVGKWHESPDFVATDLGYERDASEIDYWQWREGTYGDRYPEPLDWFGTPDHVPLEDAKTHWIARRSVEFLESFDAGAPWLLRVDFPEPHLPAWPSEPFASMYDAGGIPPWENFAETFENKPTIQAQQVWTWNLEDTPWSKWARCVALTLGWISQMDEAIGRILDAARAAPGADNTVIMYLSDHGDALGSHRMIDKHYTMYEEVVRVPFVVSAPNRYRPRVEEAFAIPTLDIGATVCEWYGLEQPGALHGRSLDPLLRGERPDDWRDCAVSTYNGQQFGLYTQRMLRTRRWKYVWNPVDIDELYDMEEDPAELVNRAGDAECAGLLAGLRRQLLAELEAFGDPMAHSPFLSRQLGNNWRVWQPRAGVGAPPAG